MGLDMYLTKKTYIGANYEFNEIGGTLELTREGSPIPIKLNRVVSIDERIGYWRKANQIHNWFVENVQGGEDDCKQYYVELEQLKQLVEVCKSVVDDISLAEELLPTRKGFFFGAYEYDEYYIQDLEDTIEMLTPVIEELEQSKHADIYYQSSW
jgi:hypothetical protein